MSFEDYSYNSGVRANNPSQIFPDLISIHYLGRGYEKGENITNVY